MFCTLMYVNSIKMPYVVHVMYISTMISHPRRRLSLETHIREHAPTVERQQEVQ